ncbi:hypothetical protein BDV25DRAFT_139139 [Aspergillus avenaceus]|uniref:Helicase C-terminal domain-containing protein n=1 Tax=Aspergillus avenaceus TaxID=36643 RepID=A0A5N6TXP1_ASPAV|nr:hypothetical protein BDV25DRAFT_139139 [Aspergillus avenaceus]
MSGNTSTLKRKTPFCETPSSRAPLRGHRRRSLLPCSNSQLTHPPAVLTTDGLHPECPEAVRCQPKSTRRSQLAHDLPPMSKLGDIYRSLTTRALELGLGKFLELRGDRPLRIATACSGTESPLLALEMVQDVLRSAFGRSFAWEHLFSAEIAPFKQAYIERNHHPRHLFRDVTELCKDSAQTAYGGMAEVPQDTDILIAGFACVDFSSLNNKRKTLQDDGESGGTFWGIFSHVRRYRPRLVILENVKTAPWPAIAEAWEEIEYLAIHAAVDTKAYYLPQTRERGYMLCVDKRELARAGLSAGKVMDWRNTLHHFQRPASSPAGMFILDVDAEVLDKIEINMASRVGNRGRVGWDLYQVRHHAYRQEHGLGDQRPFSRSQDGEACHVPDFTWKPWLRNQPERVWDTLDINYLRKLIDGYDMNHKERCIELSQGIDREIDTRAYGVAGCITPTGIPYLSTRGGPLCGLESLALQGLPLDRLILARESQRELQDLAGNAMSSTVVGAAILAALIVCRKVLEPKPGDESSAPEQSTQERQQPELCLDHELISHTIEVDKPCDVNVTDLKARAATSARYCVCERQSLIKRDILRCTLCEYTVCAECGGNPLHDFEPCFDLARSQPSDFVTWLKTILPSRLIVSGISRSTYENFETAGCPSETWDKFLDAVERVVDDELRFSEVKRSNVWTVTYEGRFTTLNCVISSSTVTWLLFAKASEDEPSICLIREILSKPIAKMSPLLNSLLGGQWEVFAPLRSRFTLTFSGTGEKIPCYEARCGIQVQPFLDAKVWSQITVGGSDEDMGSLGVDIRGTYSLLPNCGTASACLHKRTAVKDSPNMYLFLDPTKLGEPVFDSFVFSYEHEKIPGHTSRLVIAEVSHKWRSAKVGRAAETVNVFYRKSIEWAPLTMNVYSPTTPITSLTLRPLSELLIGNRPCHGANITLLSFRVPATAIDSSFCKQEQWEVTNLTEHPALLKGITWLLQRAVGPSALINWIPIVDDNQSLDPVYNACDACETCVPRQARILWGYDKKHRLKAYEDPREAGLYERQVKAMPSSFLLFHRVDENNIGDLHLTLNVQTLVHQASGRLLSSNIADNFKSSWRVVPHTTSSDSLNFPRFTIPSNRDDTPSNQPPNFRLSLRPEQLRSLAWMIRQEGDGVQPFIEEEVAEAVLSMPMWRAEGKVCVPKTVRGGILADEVGYGKTALTLGLIDSQYGNQAPPEPIKGYIPTKATLIIVPEAVIRQWAAEITKFLGRRYKVLLIKGVADLGKQTVRDIQQSDIILVNWGIFNSKAHYDKMQQLTGMPHVPPKPGRNFDDWFREAVVALRDLVEVLMERGPKGLLQSIKLRREEVKRREADFTYVPSERLKGKKYTEAKQGQQLTTVSEPQDVEMKDPDAMASEDDDSEITRNKGQMLPTLRPASKPVGGAAEAGAQSSRKVGKAKAKKQDPEEKCKIGDDQLLHIKAKENQDWTTVTIPLLQAFAFNRLVIDEFTYANPERLVPVLALHGRFKWVLSATPPLNDFADIKTIAPFLGIHLGIDNDDLQSQNQRLRILCNQRSDAEVFQSFQPPKSQAWHLNRHLVAQRFLNQFARKNIAEIDEIKFSEQIILVQPSPAEIAVYLELYKQLMTYHRPGRKVRRNVIMNDEVERLNIMLMKSQSKEESLLKRCSSLAVQASCEGDVSKEITCGKLIETREKQLEDLKAHLLAKLKMTAWLYCARDIRHNKFEEFAKSIITHSFGDRSVTEKVYPLVRDTILGSGTDDWKGFFFNPEEASQTSVTETAQGEDDMDEEMKDIKDDNEAAEEDAPAPEEPKGKQPSARSTKKDKAKKKEKKKIIVLPAKPSRIPEFRAMLRNMISVLRKLILEWVARERALRFLRTVHTVQTGTQSFQCDGCYVKLDTIKDANLLCSCGHILCIDCTRRTTEEDVCIIEGCRASGKGFNIMSAATLGRGEKDHSTRYGGSKLDKMVEIIQSIPRGEKALIFVQFPEIINAASKALELAKIEHRAIKDSDLAASRGIEKFQKSGFDQDRALILNLNSDKAAGLNLQCANHVIFLSPMLAETQYDYDSAMTQAVGRSRRYGQNKHVHIYHLLARMTIDVKIFQDRHGQVLVERDGIVTLADRDTVDDAELEVVLGGELDEGEVGEEEEDVF